MYTDGAYHNIDWFNTAFGDVEVTESNFDSEKTKGLYKYTGTWDISEIKYESVSVEYSMFNSEGQIIYNETVPVLRDGPTGEAGKDGLNAVEYSIEGSYVYKSTDILTYNFYRLEGEGKTSTEYYYKIFKKDGNDWTSVSSGHDSQVQFQPSSLSSVPSQIKITIYKDSDYLIPLDTEYSELISDGKNGVSKFYNIYCPIVVKSGDTPEFRFCINENGSNTLTTVYYRIYANEILKASGTSSSYTWPSMLTDDDKISKITCEIYTSKSAFNEGLQSVDSEDINYIKEGSNLNLYSWNDRVDLACNEFGKLKSALNQQIKLQAYKGLEGVIPTSITCAASEGLDIAVNIPTTYDKVNVITLTKNANTDCISGTLTFTVTAEGISLTKVINIGVGKDGINALDVHTVNDIVSLTCDENGNLKNKLNSNVYIHFVYGDTTIDTNSSVSVEFLSSSSSKPSSMTVGTWNKTTGGISITQNAGTSASSGYLTFKAKVTNYYGITKDFTVTFPISAVNDGATAIHYEVRGSGVYSLDTSATYSFFKVSGSNTEAADLYYKLAYSDYTQSSWTAFGTNSHGTSVTFTAKSNYQRVRVQVYSDSSYNKLVDEEIYYLVTDSPQVVVLNNFQFITTDVDNITTGVTDIKLGFIGYFNKAMTAVTCDTSKLVLPTGFSYLSTTPSTTSKEGELVLRVAKGVEVSNRGSVSLTFTMNGSSYKGSFIYAPQPDGQNRFYLTVNSETVTIDPNNNEIYPDIIFPNVMHETSDYQNEIDIDQYNSTVTEEDKKLKIISKYYPSLEEVNIKYNTASSYSASQQYYTRVHPKIAYGYTSNTKDTSKGWTIKQDDKEYMMIFYTP